MESNGKIIQIMPAPIDFYAEYGDTLDNHFYSKIVCLALTDKGVVLPMDMDSSEGLIEEVEGQKGFVIRDPKSGTFHKLEYDKPTAEHNDNDEQQ
jgi:hypothetical protein